MLGPVEMLPKISERSRGRRRRRSLSSSENDFLAVNDLAKWAGEEKICSKRRLEEKRERERQKFHFLVINYLEGSNMRLELQAAWAPIRSHTMTLQCTPPVVAITNHPHNGPAFHTINIVRTLHWACLPVKAGSESSLPMKARIRVFSPYEGPDPSLLTVRDQHPQAAHKQEPSEAESQC